MPTRVNYTTPEQRPPFAQAHLESFNLNVRARTLTGFVGLTDANGTALKSIKFEITLPAAANTKIDNLCEAIMNYLISQDVVRAGTIVSEP